MKEYKEPMVEFIPIDADIITASGDSGGDTQMPKANVPLNGVVDG